MMPHGAGVPDYGCRGRADQTHHALGAAFAHDKDAHDKDIVCIDKDIVARDWSAPAVKVIVGTGPVADSLVNEQVRPWHERSRPHHMLCRVVKRQYMRYVHF